MAAAAVVAPLHWESSCEAVWKCWSNISFRLDSAILLSERRRFGIPGVVEKQGRAGMRAATGVRLMEVKGGKSARGTKLQTKQFAYTSQAIS